MGRKEFGSFTPEWAPPRYEVDGRGKVIGGYRPPGRSNWGRWGEDDVKGTANLITPEMVVAATALAKRGRVFGLGLALGEDTPRYPSRPPAKHYMMQTGSDAVVGSPSNVGLPGFQFNDDAIDIALQGSTQWDGLAHVQSEDTLFNGWWAGNVTALGGAAVMDIAALRESFVGRGVLIDVARLLGVESLEPGQVVTPAMLDRALAAQGVEVGVGDIVLLRTGYLGRWDPSWSLDRKAEYCAGEPGLGVAGIEWVADRDIAAIACDTIGLEVLPSEPDIPRPLHVHQTLLVDLGLTIGELWDLDELAADCAADGVYEFLLVAPPLNIARAVASVINPVAIK